MISEAIVPTKEQASELAALESPLADPDFQWEGKASQEHVLKWWDICTGIAASPRRMVAIRCAATMNGIPAKTVERVYYSWLNKDRNWRELADRRRWPDPVESNLPAPFIAWVKGIAEKHQRETSFKQAYREIIGQLTLWERDPLNKELFIPGYEAPPKRNAFTGIPIGWTCGNLCKRARSTVYEKAVRRQGPKRASEFLPSIRTSRIGLEFGEIIYFDDQEHDTSINLTGVNVKAMRPQSFNALEALTGSCFEIGLKPQLFDEETGSRRELDQLDFFWFVALCLTKHGYNAKSGTILIWEHGKANPDKTGTVAERLEKITGGAVKTDMSGIWRAPEFKAMLFEGKPTGNFRFKAPIESFFNLLRNYSDALPAPTGRSYELAPEESHGLLAYNNQLLKLVDQLDTQRFLHLLRPVLEWEDYCRLHRLIMQAVDRRRDHQLEGWTKLGFTGARFRLGLDKPWIDETDYRLMPAQDRQLYDRIVQQPGCSEIFRLSPAEVYVMHRSQLTRLPMRFVPLIAPDRAWEDVTVNSSLEIVVNDKWLDSEPMVFIAKVRNAQGYEMHLERGKTYKRLLNIFDPTKLWIAERAGSRKGAFLGMATRVQTACKTNYDAILAQLGEYNHVKAAQSVEVHARMQSEAARRIEDRKHNDRVRNGHPVTAEEIRSERRSKAAVTSAAKDISDEKRAAMLTPETPHDDQNDY